MALDFQEIRKQIQELTQNATEQLEHRQRLRETAAAILEKYADQLEYLSQKALSAAALDPIRFRCALPTTESLTASYPLPALPAQAVLIAADGSQINPDRHLGIDYCLVNIGAIQMTLRDPAAPQMNIQTRLFYGQEAFNMSEKVVALIRDIGERAILAQLAKEAGAPVITITDGPIELWGGDVALSATEQNEQKGDRYFNSYLAALDQLHSLNAATAGYIDRPRTDLLVRLLEIAPEDKEVREAAKNRWLTGIIDTELLQAYLGPGARSAMFGLLTRYAKYYQDQFALHFFYLNVSRDADKPVLARVEVPAWVAAQPQIIDALHAVLVQQCQVVTTRAYPYLLTRADEIAVVSRDERDQVDMLIARELRQRGLDVMGQSEKQLSKQARQKPKRKTR
jgi:hypothetical protein